MDVACGRDRGDGRLPLAPVFVPTISGHSHYCLRLWGCGSGSAAQAPNDKRISTTERGAVLRLLGTRSFVLRRTRGNVDGRSGPSHPTRKLSARPPKLVGGRCRRADLLCSIPPNRGHPAACAIL